MTRIAIYSGEIPSTTFIERLIVGLAEAGEEVYLFGHLKKMPRYGGNVHVVGYGGKWSKLKVYAAYRLRFMFSRQAELKKLQAYIKKHNIGGKRKMNTLVKMMPVLWHRPDWFHIQWAKNTEDWMWVQDFRMKVAVSLRGAHINYSPVADERLAESYRRCFPRVDAFHAVSQAIADEAAKYGADPEKIKVAYSGLKPEMWEVPLAEKVSSSSLQLLSVGRAHWKKGYHFALDACKILKDQNIDFHYTIIGAEGDEEILFQRHQLGLEDCVTLRGRVPFAEVQHLMRTADMLWLPSVEEGIANVVLEAMAIGTLVVSTNCGGMAETVIDGETGGLVPVRDPQALATKTLEISALSDDDKNRIRESARQKLMTQHSEENMVKGMREVYFL